MPRRKVIVRLPKLNDCHGSLKKDWFVEYYVRNQKNDKMHRFRVYDGFYKLKTKKARYEHAEGIIEHYTQKLKEGWTPFEEESVVYEDEIEYHNIAKIYGRKRRDNLTARAYLSDFLKEQKIKVRPKTFESYQSKTRIFCMWLEKKGIAQNDVATIKNKHILEFFNFLIENRKLSSRTIEKYEQNLRGLFKSLEEKKLIKTNPVYNIPRIPLTVDCEARPIQPNDLVKFKNIIKTRDPQLWLALQFEFYCFIRPGSELRLMQNKWINFYAGTVTIPGHIAKNGKSQTIVIPTPFLEIINNQFMLQNFDGDFYVFGQIGRPGPTPLGKNTLRNRFNRFRDELGLSKDYKFYSWKHTGAVMASNAGIPVKDIQMQMRHHSLDVTDRYLRKMKGIDSEALKNGFPVI